MEVRLPEGFEEIRWYLPQVKERRLGPKARQFTKRLDTTMHLWVRSVESGNTTGARSAAEAITAGASVLRKIVRIIEAGNVVP